MKVKLKNFRCFKSTHPVELKKITLLVGENNSGKSSFLAAINHIYGLFNGDNISLNTPPFQLGSFKDILYDPDYPKKSDKFHYEITINDTHAIAWTFGNDDGSPKAEQFLVRVLNSPNFISFVYPNASLYIKLSKEYYRELKEKGISVTRSASGVCNINIDVQKERRLELDFSMGAGSAIRIGSLIGYFEKKLERSLSLKGERLALWLPQARRNLDELGQALFDLGRYRALPRLGGVHAMGALRLNPERVYSFQKDSWYGRDPYGETLAPRLMSIRKTRRWQDLSKALAIFGKKSGLFHGIDIQKFTKDSDFPFFISVNTSKSHASNIKDVGHGVSQLLPVIFEMLSDKLVRGGRRPSPRYNVRRYSIQQPEVHLHPRAQAEFGTLICNLVKNSNNYGFLVETHSDNLIQRIQYEVKKGNISNDDVNILFFQKTGDSARIHEINLHEDGTPKNAPASYRKFFLEEVERNFGDE